jgi:hypothetical protein
MHVCMHSIEGAAGHGTISVQLHVGLKKRLGNTCGRGTAIPVQVGSGGRGIGNRRGTSGGTQPERQAPHSGTPVLVQDSSQSVQL